MTQGTFKVTYSSVPVSMYLGRAHSFSQGGVAEIIYAIENYQGDKKVISLVSAYTEEGCSEISFDLALSLSRSGKRILIIDSEASDVGVYREMRYNLPVSINSIIQDISSDTCPVLQITGTNIFYSSFSKNIEEQAIVQNQERLETIIESLKSHFDLVLLLAESSSGLSVAKVSQVSDASIVVIEAERTRRPVVAQVIDSLKANGSHIIGLILNKRPLYIPPAIYSMLYKS